MIKTEQDSAIGTAERRAEPRVHAGVPVLLRAPNAHPMEACLLDISSRGARLRIPEGIPAGMNVRIEGPDLLLFGIVKRCRAMDGAYDVGLVLSVPLEVLGQLRKLNTALSQFS